MKARQLRTLMAKKDLVVGVGAGTALEAKLIERAGFDFVWSSSLGISASYAVPDASLISMSQYLQAARAMNEVIGIPIVADCDTGYGNANNVIYATKLFEQAGIAGMSIEDKQFPKDNSLLEGGRQVLADMEEFAGRIMAAKDAQRSENFVVIARVEALIAGWGQEEALKRAHRYVEAGADCILIHSKATSPDEIVEFIQAWELESPLVLVPTTYATLTEQTIRDLGKVRLVIYANHPLRAAVRAMEETLREIRSAQGIHTVDPMIAPVSRIFEIQGVLEMKEKEARFLR
ncbi:MAG: phosphoenolpyruvate phosphomutase [Anaerolineales bacterium]|nr:phosphoenolpyruvate phosphomutase [Anaerolineales bacterium]